VYDNRVGTRSNAEAKLVYNWITTKLKNEFLLSLEHPVLKSLCKKFLLEWFTPGKIGECSKLWGDRGEGGGERLERFVVSKEGAGFGGGNRMITIQILYTFFPFQSSPRAM